MIHAFLLIVILNGQTISKDMYFRSATECVTFAQILARQGQKLTSYCIPVKIDPDKVKPY